MSLQPGIRYVTSRDGTRLAMAVWGSGPPIVGVALHLVQHPINRFLIRGL